MDTAVTLVWSGEVASEGLFSFEGLQYTEQKDTMDGEPLGCG